MKSSRRKMPTDPETNESYVPYVVETSIGLDRMFLAVLAAAYKEEVLPDGETRTVLSLPPFLAPIGLAVFPLIKKDGLPEKAQEILKTVRLDYNCLYDEKDSIGKRYRRMDAVGTPYCITVDHQTLEDNTVTLRDRDTMVQERIAIDKLPALLDKKLNKKYWLRSSNKRKHLTTMSNKSKAHTRPKPVKNRQKDIRKSRPGWLFMGCLSPTWGPAPIALCYGRQLAAIQENGFCHAAGRLAESYAR